MCCSDLTTDIPVSDVAVEDSQNVSEEHKNKPAGKKSNKKKSSGTSQQTDPPSVPICKLYPAKNFPVGEIMEYKTEQDG